MEEKKDKTIHCISPNAIEISDDDAEKVAGGHKGPVNCPYCERKYPSYDDLRDHLPRCPNR